MREFLFEALGLEELAMLFPPRGAALQRSRYAQTAEVMQRNHASQFGVRGRATSTASTSTAEDDDIAVPWYRTTVTPDHVKLQDDQTAEDELQARVRENQDKRGGQPFVPPQDRANRFRRLPAGHVAGLYGREVDAAPPDLVRMMAAPEIPSQTQFRPPTDSEDPRRMSRRLSKEYSDTMALSRTDRTREPDVGARRRLTDRDARIRHIDLAVQHQQPYSEEYLHLDVHPSQRSRIGTRYPLPPEPATETDVASALAIASAEASRQIVWEEATGTRGPLRMRSGYRPDAHRQERLRTNGAMLRPDSDTGRYIGGEHPRLTRQVVRDLDAMAPTRTADEINEALKDYKTAAYTAVLAVQPRQDAPVEVGFGRGRLCVQVILVRHHALMHPEQVLMEWFLL